MKRNRYIKEYPNWIVDRRHEGMDHKIIRPGYSVVMDNAFDREKMKLKVKPYITINSKLWAGHNTVAIFKIKPKQHEAPSN